MRNLPITNSRAVIKAPTPTSRQRIMASGKNRYTNANSSVVTPSDSAKSMSLITSTPISGNTCCSHPVNTLSTALITKETNSNRATLRMSPNERNRCLINAPMPTPWVFTLRFQISLMLSCRVTKKVVAVKMSVPTPMAVAKPLLCCRVNLAILSWRNLAASAPTKPLICP